MRLKQTVALTLFGVFGSGGFVAFFGRGDTPFLAWNHWLGIGLWIAALLVLAWGFWGFIKVRIFRQPLASIKDIEARYYIAEQGTITVEVEAVISCTNPPQQLASLQLLIARKVHDYIDVKPPFKDDITTERVSYRAWYKMGVRDFLGGKVRYKIFGYPRSLFLQRLANRTRSIKGSSGSSNLDDIMGQLIARIGGEDFYSQEFKVWSKQEIADKVTRRTGLNPSTKHK